MRVDAEVLRRVREGMRVHITMRYGSTDTSQALGFGDHGSNMDQIISGLTTAILTEVSLQFDEQVAETLERMAADITARAHHELLERAATILAERAIAAEEREQIAERDAAERESVAAYERAQYADAERAGQGGGSEQT